MKRSNLCAVVQCKNCVRSPLVTNPDTEPELVLVAQLQSSFLIVAANYVPMRGRAQFAYMQNITLFSHFLTSQKRL